MQGWYDTKNNAQKGVCMRQLFHFKIGTKDDPVDKLCEMEDLHVKLNNAGVTVRMFCFRLACCRVLARGSRPKPQAGLRSKGNNKPGSQQVRDTSSIFWQVEGSSKSLALAGKVGSGYGGKGGRARGGRDRSGKVKEVAATAVQTVEPGKRRVRRGVSGTKLRATTATDAPQSYAKGVEG